MGGVGQSVSDLILIAYGASDKPARLAVETDLPTNKYDFIATLPQGSAMALQQELKNQFGVVAKREMRETDVLLLKVQNPEARALKPTPATHASGWSEDDQGRWTDAPISGLISGLEAAYNLPVIDQTGLAGRYSFRLKLDQIREQDTIRQALLDQVGLALVPARERIEMLVIEKAKD
jgi:uncharacterized protein (TIGR03435 family)